jgi:SAM-dependent methyltransferase
MTELELIIDLHKNSDRQGPGSEKDTLKALGFLNFDKHQKLHVADMGCGSGGPTITLAQQLNAQISAVDLFPEFLNELQNKAQHLGLLNKITTVEASIEDLLFKRESLDLIWSEGAIYNIGFSNGIQQWKNYLKKGGYLAVSEITWMTQSRPNAIEDFWTREYPEIDTAANKLKLLETSGYSVVGYFYLSENSWIEHYYKPMQARFELFLNRHNYTELARKVVADNQAEIEMYQKFKDYYSYGFYIARNL